ncbi:arylsulfatase B-like [Diadema antillarum]|uniref:arylsulfatase B-like n=1 Tax=Diadema antillarum TaxID=105358 RepID=UPI003A88926C
MYSISSSLLLCCSVLLLCLASIHCAPTRPNIVFILADDYGYHDIGYHGSEIKTPNLDKLAAEGVKLENYYVQPICTPTRSQLMSGKYQIHTGLQHSIIWSPQPSCLPVEDPTLADQLLKVGYATHIVGKWHLGFYKKACWPTRRGFQTFFGYLTGSEDYYKHTHPSNGWNGKDLRDGETEVEDEYKGKYSTHIFAKRAEEIIHNHDATQPLFLYIPFQAVHSPLQVPVSYTEQYSFIQNKARRQYAGMVSCMDEAVGNITQALKKTKLWDDTVLIFSTDNGGQILSGGNNWPLRGWKKSLWEGGVHGVGFVASPLLDPSVRGTVSKELIHVSDWYPTLVQGVAGGTVNSSALDGYNVWNAIRTGSASPRHELLHNIDPLRYSPSNSVAACKEANDASLILPSKFNQSIRAAIRYKDWKLITGQPGNGSWIPTPDSGLHPFHPVTPPGKDLWLFNIKDDPTEKTDLSDQNHEMVAFLLDRLQVYYWSSVPVNYPKCDPNANPALHNDTWTNWE